MNHQYLIKAPVITEKSLRLVSEQNVYTFKVDRNANKAQIKKAIESLFKVNVKAVNMINMASKNRRTGRKRMKSALANWKKALVKLPKDQSIDLFDTGGES